MSYARFGADSDVYMYHHVGGFIDCCACSLNEGKRTLLNTRSEAISHLIKHKEAGHMVPEHTIERLQEELKSIGEHISSRKESK